MSFELAPDPTTMQQPSATVRPANGTKAPRLRKGRQTRQGKKRLLTIDALDARTAAYVAARRLVETLSKDLGGDLSEGQRQLVVRAALVGAIVSDFETRWVAGEHAPLGEYLAAVNVQRRVLTTLGLERQQKNVTPTFGQVLADDAARQQREDAEADTEKRLAFEQRQREQRQREKASTS
jgi:hypothetical protein